MENILGSFNLIVVPIYCIYVMKRKSLSVFLNPCFYLVFFAYLYLTLPSTVLPEYYLNNYLGLSRDSIQTTNLLCNWYTFIFLLFFAFSKNYSLPNLSFKPRKKTYQISLVFTAVLSLVFLGLLIKYGPMLLQSEDRVDAIAQFVELVYDPYKVRVLLNVFIASVTVLVWRSKNVIWYALLLLPIMLEMTSNGRAISIVCILFIYVNQLLISRRTYLWLFGAGLGGLFLSTIVRRFELSWQESLLEFVRVFNEFINTRASATVVYQYFNHDGDLLPYLLASVLNILPNSLSEFLLGEEVYANLDYVKIIGDANFSKLGYGLAGNMIGESLYYGGITFAIISPFIIGGTYFFINKLRIYKTFPGLIFMIFTITAIPNAMRQSFYQTFLSSTYLMFSYLGWLTYLEYGRSVVGKKQRLIYQKVYQFEPYEITEKLD